MQNEEQKKTESKPPLIFAAMSQAMRDIEAVSKDRVNKDQGFKYRGIDDVYNAIHSAFAKASVFCTPHVISRERTDRTTKNGSVWNHILLSVIFKFHTTDGSHIEVGPIFSEGLDSSDKGTMKALAHAHKYALLQMLMIPTEETKDVDVSLPPSEFISGEQAKAEAERRETEMRTAKEAQKPMTTVPANTPNFAPASLTDIKRIDQYRKDRHITPEEFAAYLRNCLHVQGSKDLRIDMVDLIIDLLKDEGTNSATLMAMVARAQSEKAKQESKQ